MANDWEMLMRLAIDEFTKHGGFKVVISGSRAWEEEFTIGNIFESPSYAGPSTGTIRHIEHTYAIQPPTRGLN